MVDALASIEAIVEANPLTTIAVHDHRGVIVHVTPAVEVVFGWSPEAVLGRRLSDLVYEEDRYKIVEDHPRHEKGQVGWLRFRMHRGDGSHEWVETRSRAREARDGTRYIVSITRPLTDTAFEDPIDP